VRADPPRPTALAWLARSLSAGQVPDHPVLAGPGWWKRPGRFYAPPPDATPLAAPAVHVPGRTIAPILVTGATGTLGRAFGRMCVERGLEHRLLARADLDITDAASVEKALALHRPWAVINAAGYVRVDDAEREHERCFRENVLGPENVARACADHRIGFVTFSSDLVFDGERRAPYVETDAPGPLNVYGRTKTEAERRVLACNPAALVVRTSAFFGPWDAHNYVTLALRAFQSREPFRAASDAVVSPTYVPDLVNASLDLLVDRANGIWHLSNGEPVTWTELAERAAEAAGVAPASLVPCRTEDLRLAAPRPRYSALASARSRLMPSLAEALARYAALLRPVAATGS